MKLIVSTSRDINTGWLGSVDEVRSSENMAVNVVAELLWESEESEWKTRCGVHICLATKWVWLNGRVDYEDRAMREDDGDGLIDLNIS